MPWTGYPVLTDVSFFLHPLKRDKGMTRRGAAFLYVTLGMLPGIAPLAAADSSVASAAAPAVAPGGTTQRAPPKPQSTESKPATDPAIDERQTELRGLQDTLDASDAQRRKIEAEIETLRNDRARLNAALIDTTARVSAAEAKISDAEKRLDTLLGSEEATRHSLESRRNVIAEVLASLQRMGVSPPPAFLVAPEDMLQAIRTSMLLGAVLPEMRAETEALAADLSELSGCGNRLRANAIRLRNQVGDLGQEKQRLVRADRGTPGLAWHRRTGARGRTKTRRRHRPAGDQAETADREDGKRLCRRGAGRRRGAQGRGGAQACGSAVRGANKKPIFRPSKTQLALLLP